jgi:uncharacterized protein (DUF433 family)
MPTRPRLTPKEVAAFADVPVNVVEKAIEDHLLPVHREATISKRPRRLLDPWSVAYVAVTGHLKGRLTAAEKRAFSRRLRKARPEEIERGHWEIVPALTVDIGRLVGDRMSRASRYCSARDRYITVDEDIKGGTPVIRGTRMTVYSVLGRIERGDTVDDLAAENPDIPREAFEAAVLYARANPLVGRPGGRPWERWK